MIQFSQEFLRFNSFVAKTTLLHALSSMHQNLYQFTHNSQVNKMHWIYAKVVNHIDRQIFQIRKSTVMINLISIMKTFVSSQYRIYFWIDYPTAFASFVPYIYVHLQLRISCTHKTLHKA
jgi:hypothetical protein